jgi:hypothetical protein
MYADTSNAEIFRSFFIISFNNVRLT